MPWEVSLLVSAANGNIPASIDSPSIPNPADSEPLSCHGSSAEEESSENGNSETIPASTDSLCCELCSSFSYIVISFCFFVNLFS